MASETTENGNAGWILTLSEHVLLTPKEVMTVPGMFLSVLVFKKITLKYYKNNENKTVSTDAAPEQLHFHGAEAPAPHQPCPHGRHHHLPPPSLKPAPPRPPTITPLPAPAFGNRRAGPPRHESRRGPRSPGGTIYRPREEGAAIT